MPQSEVKIRWDAPLRKIIPQLEGKFLHGGVKYQIHVSIDPNHLIIVKTRDGPTLYDQWIKIDACVETPNGLYAHLVCKAVQFPPPFLIDNWHSNKTKQSSGEKYATASNQPLIPFPTVLLGKYQDPYCKPVDLRN